MRPKKNKHPRLISGGIPDYMKEWKQRAPYHQDIRTDYEDGSYSQFQSRGSNVNLREAIDLGLLKIPTGRKYKDFSFRSSREDYSPSGEYISGANVSRGEHRDDAEKIYSFYKGSGDDTRRGGMDKRVEISGEDLNWFQRNFPKLFLERYKVKSKYSPEGELVRRVTTSRAGGRQVENFPTQAELQAIFEEDMRRLREQGEE
jgi:hypothetical protein